MIGGSGNDVMFAGTGNDTMTGGAGTNLFAFNNGGAGGSDVITDFSANDVLWLTGYDSTATNAAFQNAAVSNGALTVTLPDNTKVTFLGITNAGSIDNNTNIHFG